MPLYAGFCETDITPPLGVWMCGYAFRPSGCVAIHDSLYARAAVWTDGGETVAILSMDLLGLDFESVDRVRDGIAQETGIPPHAVMLAATHTHGGPNVGQLNTMGSRDEAYIEILMRKLVSITRQAHAEMGPVSMAYGRAPVQIGVNRRQVSAKTGVATIGFNAAGPLGPFVDVVGVRSPDRRAVAALFSHACHPTTLGGDNLRITADYCGYACAGLRAAGAGMPLFLQGCAGNINPRPRGTFEDAARHGVTLGAAAVAALAGAESVGPPSVSAAEETIELPLIPPPDMDECARQVSEWESRLADERNRGDVGKILHAQGLLAFAQYQSEQRRAGGPSYSKPFAMQVLTISGIRFVGLPAEMFVQYGLDFQQQASGPVIPVAYANGVHGYIPTAADFPYGGYEVDGSHRYYGTLPFAPESEPEIRRAAYGMLGITAPDYTPYSI